MFLSKKQSRSSNPSRYDSKKPDQQVSFIFTHRPQQSAHDSLRCSNEKVVKLRGNSKNSGIKMVSQDKSTITNERSSKHERKLSNVEISQSKKYLLNSNDSTASIHFHKNGESTKKQNCPSTLNTSMTIKMTASSSKANKQNKNTIDQPQIQRKKSSQKGLILTKKVSNDASYLRQNDQKAQNQSSKPKSARVERPLAQNYVFLNLNNFSYAKPRQAQNKKKLSIDFDAYCKMNKQEEQKKKETLENFYSQRNSMSNIYQTGVPSKQPSKEKISINMNDKYGTLKMQKKPSQTSKKLELSEMYNSIMLKQKQKLNQKMAKESHRGSVPNVSFIEKPEMTNRQPKKSFRMNNYMQEASSFIESNHKRILSILQKSSGSKIKEQYQRQKEQHTSRNHSNHQTQRQTVNAEKQKKPIYEIIKYSPNSFSYDHVVGKGGFGKVWKVHCKRTNGVYALKEMSKALIISKKSVPSVMNEQQLLKDLKNPFLVNMVQSFQTRQNLYLLMDYLSGGDLRHHLAFKKYFTEDQTKFIIICILLGLKYLHENKIIHRDIKPQNIVLDEKGFARITDLGVARKWRQNNATDTSGTPGYMAPQVLCRQNHSYEADYFAVGVITYEMMLRKRPYYGKSRKEIRDEVLAKQVQIKRHQIPQGWSLEGADFINRMIQRKPSNRLGFNGINQIFTHPWLRKVQLHKIQQKRVQAPYVPQKICKGESDYLNYTSSEDTEIKELIAQNEIMLRQKDVQNLFEGYEHF